MKRQYLICVMVTMLATTGMAQTKRESFKWFDRGDAIYWAGAGLDIASSIDKKEANPLWRDSNHIFSPGKNLAFKFGIWGAFKALESHYTQPKERRMIRWAKIGVGVAFTALAVRNFGVEKVRR